MTTPSASNLIDRTYEPGWMPGNARRQRHLENVGRWAIVLAAGEGKRLQAVTRQAGKGPVPKQFCSLVGGPSLLQTAISRAERLVPAERIVPIVAAQHRRWWQSELAGIPNRNIVVQPEDRGTAVGVLLPLLSIVDRDPEAIVIIMPSDHFVAREQVLSQAITRAVSEVSAVPERLVLLGIEPETLDPAYGWILPASNTTDDLSDVRSFVEKPDWKTARDLVDRGAVINTFLLVAHAAALLEIYRRYTGLLPLFRFFRSELSSSGYSGSVLRRQYRHLPQVDFSRDLLERSPRSLRVLTVTACGWNDLGTPERVRKCLARFSWQQLVSGSVRTGAETIPELASLCDPSRISDFPRTCSNSNDEKPQPTGRGGERRNWRSST